MNYKEQLQNLSKKYTQSFSPGGVVGNPGFGTKIIKQYKDENNREIVEFSDGKTMYTDSPEYKQLYSEGLLYGESPDKVTYPQENANPEMQRYKRIESMYPFSEFVQPYFEGQSGAIARATGQSQDKLENMPEDYKTKYDKWINEKWAREVFESNPQNEGESRGEYLNRVTQGMNPQVVKSLYDNLPSGQSETLWQATGRGLENLISNQTGQGSLEERIQNNSSLSDFEKQKMIREAQENSFLSNVGANFQTLSALTVPSKIVQSAYKPGYSFQDALQGRQNKASIIEDIGTDPLNLLGIGLASKLRNAVSVASKVGAEVNTVKRLPLSSFNKEDEFYRVIVGDDAYNDILQSGVIRTKKPDDFVTISGGINLDRRGTTAYPSFSKGKVSVEYAQDNPNHYIVATNDPSIKPSTSGRHGKGTTMFPTDENGKHLNSLSADKTNIYKHVGDGNYELVPKHMDVKNTPTDDISSFKSDIDWGKWNPEIPNNKPLLEEYHQIEKAAKLKANGNPIWWGNDDGSMYLGPRERWIQEQSINFKKAYPDGFEVTNRGIYNNKLNGEQIAKNYPKGRGIFGGDPLIAHNYSKNGKPITNTQDTDGVYQLYYPKTKEAITIDAKGRSWREVPTEGLKGVPNEKTDLSNVTRADTDDIATWLELNNKPSVRIKNVFDGVDAEYVDIINHKPGNYLKSRYGNNGMFDLNNPDIFKGLSIPLGLGLGITQINNSEKVEKQSNNINNFQKGGTMGLKNQLNYLAQKFQKGGQKPYSEKSYDEADIKDFYKKMVGSDWYKNRLIKNGYDDQYNIGVEGVLKKRMNRIDRAHVDNVQSDDGFNNQVYRFLTSGDFVKTGTGAYYNHDEDEITLVKSQMDRLKAHPRSVLAHEFGHAETGKSISNIEQEMLGKLKPDDKLTTHNKSPFENKSDINTLRYNLYKNNLYDPSTGKFKTKSGLFESKLLKPVDTDFTTKRLQQHYGNKYLEFLMNTIAQNDSEQTVSYAQVGGQTPPEDWKQKYSTNPYFKDREDWGDKLSYKFPNAKTTVKDSIYTVARQSGVDPAILYTSAMEEGMKLALNGRDTFERREGYNQFRKSNPKGAQEFPIDGGYFYGLNTFGDKYGKLIKPSSLPRGFKYAPYPQKDSQGNTLYTSAAFRTHDDAIAAKAAMMKQVEDAMTARLQKNGLNLTPEARKFFDMVGYNMGEDKTIEMIQSYQQKGYLKDDRFLDPNFQPASWKEPYTNVQRRYQNYRILNDQGYFKDYAPQPAPDNGQQTVVANKQVGGRLTANEFMKDYIGSPMYVKRLQKMGDSTPEITQMSRLYNLKTVKFTNRNDDANRYDPDKHVININKEETKKFKQNPESTKVHELSHATGSIGGKGIVFPGALNQQEINALKWNMKPWKDMYADRQGEYKADMDAFRFMLKRDGIYDTGKTEFTQKELDIAKQKYKNSTEIGKRFLDRSREDRKIIWLMNNIASNDKQNSPNIAQTGGNIGNSLKDQLNALAQKFQK